MIEIIVYLLLDLILAWLAFCWGYRNGKMDTLIRLVEKLDQIKKEKQNEENRNQG